MNTEILKSLIIGMSMVIAASVMPSKIKIEHMHKFDTYVAPRFEVKVKNSPY